jgi:hypothetical protein
MVRDLSVQRPDGHVGVVGMSMAAALVTNSNGIIEESSIMLVLRRSSRIRWMVAANASGSDDPHVLYVPRRCVRSEQVILDGIIHHDNNVAGASACVYPGFLDLKSFTKPAVNKSRSQILSVTAVVISV